GRVVHIGLRSTRILTRDDVEITVPNSVMGNGMVTNETGGPQPRMRVRIRVEAAYGSDVDQVRAALLKVPEGVAGICATPEPRVRFRAFGGSGLQFELLCWIQEPSLRGRVVDALNTAVYKCFAEEGIEIPYAKQDLYIKEMPPAGGRPALPAFERLPSGKGREFRTRVLYDSKARPASRGIGPASPPRPSRTPGLLPIPSPSCSPRWSLAWPSDG
ncbi:MAG: mechanosensitive ion channel family protein, partial [Planctomycetota bacterium]